VRAEPLVADDGPALLDAVRSSRARHRPFADPPDSADRFADLLARSAGAQQRCFVLRHDPCGQLVGESMCRTSCGVHFSSRRSVAFVPHAGHSLMRRGLGR
jgi:hypothetical protein